MELVAIKRQNLKKHYDKKSLEVWKEYDELMLRLLVRLTGTPDQPDLQELFDKLEKVRNEEILEVKREYRAMYLMVRFPNHMDQSFVRYDHIKSNKKDLPLARLTRDRKVGIIRDIIKIKVMQYLQQ